jgi:hypothetical protein
MYTLELKRHRADSHGRVDTLRARPTTAANPDWVRLAGRAGHSHDPRPISPTARSCHEVDNAADRYRRYRGPLGPPEKPGVISRPKSGHLIRSLGSLATSTFYSEETVSVCGSRESVRETPRANKAPTVAASARMRSTAASEYR